MSRTETDSATDARPVLADHLTRAQLATELHVTPRTLARWRWQRKGPPSILLAGRRFYRRAAVVAWLDAQVEAQS